MEFEEKTISRKEIYQGPIFKLVQDQVELPEGKGTAPVSYTHLEGWLDQGFFDKFFKEGIDDVTNFSVVFLNWNFLLSSDSFGFLESHILPEVYTSNFLDSIHHVNTFKWFIDFDFSTLVVDWTITFDSLCSMLDNTFCQIHNIMEIGIGLVNPVSYTHLTVLATSKDNIDWDINPNSGWSPDYADPSTYLDAFDPTSGPTLLGALGIAPGSDSSAIKAVGLDKYKELLDDANSEKTDLEKRYSKYAKAQAWLTDSALVIPVHSDGAQMLVTKKVPGTGADGWVGDKTGENSYKYLKIQDKIVTSKEMEEFRKKFAEEKAKSNEEYQKQLSSHIKD